jgi:NADH-quinone oxidoreductase subunit L
MLIGALSLGGIFPLAGFWSKDLVLSATWERALQGEGAGYLFYLIFALITVFLTAFYMFRVIFMTFFGPYRGQGHPHESPPVMTVPLLILAVPSVLVGLWGSPLMNDGFQHFLEGPSFHGHEFNLILALLGLGLGIAGIAFAYLVYVPGIISASALGRTFRPAYNLFLNRYYIDELYQWLIDRILLAFSSFLAFFVDPRIIDGVVNGLGRLAVRISTTVRQLQTGQVQSYAMAVFVGLALISLVAVVINPLLR